MTAFLEHLAGIEDQLRLLRAADGMLTAGDMPEYLFRRTHGVVGLLRRLIEDSCARAIATGEERLTRELLAATPIRLGNLADLDPDAGEIPDIPAAMPRRRSRRRNAGPGTRSSTTTAPGRPPVSSRRPGRSLDPLPGESLQGFLLRLSCRLRIAPLRLARLTGCAAASSPAISRRLHDRPRHRNLRARHTADSERGRCPDARPLGSPLPPDRPGPVPVKPGVGNPRAWLFSPGIRYCPSCLRGDGSPVQEQYGGPWRKYWHPPGRLRLPPHRMLLMDDCPQEHSPAEQGNWQLIRRAADSTLHPAQCRRPAHAAGQGPGQPALRHPPGPGRRRGQRAGSRPARRLLTLSSACSASSTTRTRPRPLPAPSRTSESSPRCYATPGPSAGTSWTPAWPQQPAGTSAG